MPFDTSLLGAGVTYAGNQIAALSGAPAYITNGDGTFSLDGTTYFGAESDFGPGAITSMTVSGYNQAVDPGLVTWSQTAGGTTTSPYGGFVVGWTADSLLVEVLDGFVASNQATGAYVGTPDTSEAFWLSDTDISYEANGGNGPTGYNENTGLFSPDMTFGQSCTFSPTEGSGSCPSAVPEPSTNAVLLVALVMVMIVKTPLFRRIRSSLA